MQTVSNSKVLSFLRLPLFLVHFCLVGTLICIAASTAQAQGAARAATVSASGVKCTQTVTAKVVALEQVYYYNRFGSFNPDGIIYALRRDVVDKDGKQLPLDVNWKPKEDDLGRVKLRETKRPRPLVLRVNEGDCLEVTFTNLLSPLPPRGERIFSQMAGKQAALGPVDPDITVSLDAPATRSASMHVLGLEFAPGSKCANDKVDDKCADGAFVGTNPSSLAKPGETVVYKWYAKKQGGYFIHSAGATTGGQGNGGQIVNGLFGAVNVQPRGSKWYRSQVTHIEMSDARTGSGTTGNTVDPRLLNYDNFKLLNGNELIHSDLNAIIVPDPISTDCSKNDKIAPCGEAFREFTVIFHDEVKGVQAFPELENDQRPDSYLKDGMAINYGSGGMGAMLLANRKKIGPAKDCPECKLEEFFLSSWANGDPALIVEKDKDGKGTKNLYQDDPSNVHHSYLGDPVRFVNIHAGPKETHVFHLHAHQWLQDSEMENSSYLDSQTISPGASFSYNIAYGGGNRNLTVGDSIFHCHLYPHFAQGMWGLWRVHDVFEDGTIGLPTGTQPGRNLPDAEIDKGTLNVALVPLPQHALPPIPTPEFLGYPFYIPGKPGHRAPQPPMDLAVENGVELNGGLPRHIIIDGQPEDGSKVIHPAMVPGLPGSAATDEEQNQAKQLRKNCQDDTYRQDLYNRGRCISSGIAENVKNLTSPEPYLGYARELSALKLQFLPANGTPAEQIAMKFHAGQYDPANPGNKNLNTRGVINELEPWRYNESKGYLATDEKGNKELITTIKTAEGTKEKVKKPYLFAVNGRLPQPGAPFADPCPSDVTQIRKFRSAYIQFDLTVNKAGWHDPQARIPILEKDLNSTLRGSRPAEPLFFRAHSGDCIDFRATNLIPSNLNLDDFQVFSPTDIIGQHIHLVKFDVTASDGSANGWNYEDGTYSPDEVRERILAHNKLAPTGQQLSPKTHPLFLTGGALDGDKRGLCADHGGKDDDYVNHPWCGAQTTVQRWWADPMFKKEEVDTTKRTLGTVFTHDHFGPSSHQHHGFYAGLVIEPDGSTWKSLNGKVDFGTQSDGGPTSYAANVLTVNEKESRREFNLAFADFAIVYDPSPAQDDQGKPIVDAQGRQVIEERPVNAPNRIEKDLPIVIDHDVIPRPEAISSGDPGTQLINYRNEPIPLRIAEKGKDGILKQKSNPQGDIANVFSTNTHKDQPENLYLKYSEFAEPKRTRKPGDPATPILPVLAGDRVQLRLIQGAQEEQHVFNIHGVNWLSQPEAKASGYSNGQAIGISEHFEFNAILKEDLSPTDHLYSSSTTDNLWDGMWGIMRVFGEPINNEEAKTDIPELQQLPGNALVARSVGRNIVQKVCDDNKEKIRHFTVKAYRAGDIGNKKRVVYSQRHDIFDPNGIVFVKLWEHLGVLDNKYPAKYRKDREDKVENEILKGTRPLEPLILRARAGECIKVSLYNGLKGMVDGPKYPESWSFNLMPPITDHFNFNQFETSSRVSLHPQLLALNVHENDGSNVGRNIDSTLPSGINGFMEYEWYAGNIDIIEGTVARTPIEFGAVALKDMGDVIKHSSHGAVGALIIEPEDADWKPDPNQAAVANVDYNFKKDKNGNYIKDINGNKIPEKSFREFVLIYQDDLSLQTKDGAPLFNLREADDAEDTGAKAFNYRTEPLWARLGAGSAAEFNVMNSLDQSEIFSSGYKGPLCGNQQCGDPETPIFTAIAGEAVRFRLVQPSGHPRQHSFTISGHNWSETPWNTDSSKQVDKTRFDLDGKTELKTPRGNTTGVVNGFGPMRHVNLLTTAGGKSKIPGDYIYRTQDSFNVTGGLWGIFRVTPQKSPKSQVGNNGNTKKTKSVKTKPRK